MVDKIYSDKSPELRKAIRDLGIVHPRSTPHRSTTNGSTEANLGVTIAGGRASALQAGAPHSWWPISVAYFCNQANFIGLHAERPSPHFSRFGEEFKGLTPIHGQAITYLPPKNVVVALPKFKDRTIAASF